MLLSSLLKYIFLPIFAYLLGSLPWGLVLTRIFTSTDIRKEGSGNIGATNVRRVAGTPMGILTLIGDVFKGALPVYLACRLTAPGSPLGEVYISIVAICAFSGHLFPVFLKLKDGGKGVATASGCFMVISPAAFLVSLLVFVLLICWSGRVSAGSLTASASLPVAIWKATDSSALTVCAVLACALIFYRHRDNIKRLFAGTEPSVFKK